MIDKSNIFPTRIKVNPGEKFVLNQGDFVSIGLSVDLVFNECKSKNPPQPSGNGFINIRYLDDDISKELKEFINSQERVN